ncbi:MAG: hypothetical protein KKH08_02885 [Candidatus Omnitrophica bacterium]|nr:hypothetical protein [Candidatus Omnitrophota bacterium]
MRKIYKIINIALIFILVVDFSCQGLYAIECSYQRVYLRKPLEFNDSDEIAPRFLIMLAGEFSSKLAYKAEGLPRTKLIDIAKQELKFLLSNKKAEIFYSIDKNDNIWIYHESRKSYLQGIYVKVHIAGTLAGHFAIKTEKEFNGTEFTMDHKIPLFRDNKNNQEIKTLEVDTGNVFLTPEILSPEEGILRLKERIKDIAIANREKDRHSIALILSGPKGIGKIAFRNMLQENFDIPGWPVRSLEQLSFSGSLKYVNLIQYDGETRPEVRKRFENPGRTVITVYLSDTNIVSELPKLVIGHADFIIDSRAEIKLAPEKIAELLKQGNFTLKDL